jgi:hypothetical protein
MSEAMEMRCVVSSGDLACGASSTVSSETWGMPFASYRPSLFGMSGTGESARRSWAEPEDSRRLSSERERERSACEVGRGVVSGASSNVSCSQVSSAHVAEARVKISGSEQYLLLCRSCASSLVGAL